MPILNSVAIRLMLPGDLALAYSITRDAYSFNFGHHWEDDGLAEYLDIVFGKEVLEAQLDDPKIRYYVAFADEQPAGFMKLRLCSNLPGLDPEKGVELEKLYILPNYQGAGIGQEFLALAFRVARDLEKELLWLGVIDKNEAAIALYERLGFKRHSTARVRYPKFKEELKGMWRMAVSLR